MDSYGTSVPFDRELKRRQLAHRLVVHRARTRTIYLLTGLSRHQLATLRRRWRIASKMRHRGPPPTSFSVFHATLRMRAEAAALGVFWKVHSNLKPSIDSAQRTISPADLGERLCDVFEAYVACFPQSELEIEHLVLLVRGLEDADAIALSNCSNCEGVVVVDLLGARRRLCIHCQRSSDAAAPTAIDLEKPSVGTAEPVQQELF